jgi:hypothetical protein
MAIIRIKPSLEVHEICKGEAVISVFDQNLIPLIDTITVHFDWGLKDYEVRNGDIVPLDDEITATINITALEDRKGRKINIGSEWENYIEHELEKVFVEQKVYED